MIDAGPVVPMQPPTTFEQMTKKRSVSIALPGPTMRLHQPVLPVSGLTLATYWSPVRGVAYEDGVGTFRVELAIGLVGNFEVIEAAT